MTAEFDPLKPDIAQLLRALAGGVLVAVIRHLDTAAQTREKRGGRQSALAQAHHEHTPEAPIDPKPIHSVGHEFARALQPSAANRLPIIQKRTTSFGSGTPPT